MRNHSDSRVDRRFFLRIGVLAGVAGLAGCGEPSVSTVTTPPAEKGNRDKLKGLIDKAERGKFSKKK
jgi:hypothetical protein